jgi:SRSO17 transposase
MADYVRGLLEVAHRNGWTLSAHAGLASPDSTQRLLRTAQWDIDGVRDDIRSYAVNLMRDRDGVWLVDETGFAKRGNRSVGVAPQYRRRTNRVENCQVGLFLIYASPLGEAIVDRELYLPPEWAEDAARKRRAGVPAARAYTSKPQLAVAMLTRAYEAGLLTGWVTADKTYGSHRSLRTWLINRHLRYVLATTNDETLTLPGGVRRKANDVVAQVLDADGPPASAWIRRTMSAGPYAGREFRWVTIDLTQGRMPADWKHSLLIRRQLAPDRGTHHLKTACYRCAGPADTPLADLVRIASSRWRSEDCFDRARRVCGLDDYQVRDWRAWYAHVTLSMVALAYHVTSYGSLPVSPSLHGC